MRKWLLLGTMSVGIGVLSALVTTRVSSAPANAGWTKGKGWGWIWGKDDEVGSLNAMTDTSRAAALKLATQGKVYDLGALYDRESYKWPGHNPAEIMTFRTPEGVKRQNDFQFAKNPTGTAWHSCAIFISDNVATQIDGLGHATEGPECVHRIPDHWYNGFKEADWGGNWGIRKCGADTIPPIVARGVMIDVAGYKNVTALPAHYAITPDDLRGALARQKTELKPGDVVLVRTGTLHFWGEAGHDDKGLIKEHDSAGINLDSAKWLVEQNGAMLLGSDTSGLEVGPPPAGSKSFMPCHNYLLIEQGVHIAEFHFLEDLSKDKVYEFTYVCTTNKIKGASAGFTLRPIAMR